MTRRVILASAFAGLWDREGLLAAEPEVSSFDLSLIDEPAVPNELFFVRDHFPGQRLSAAGWKLSVAGAVAKPFEISVEDLSSASRKTVAATLECAENPVGGGLVSHAEWTGAPVASLLEQAQVRGDAAFVRLAGADGFTRVIPIAKAVHPDTLVVTRMNGERLPAKHGLPLRAIVPGWYGMDSVKYLREITVLSEPDPPEVRSNRYVRATRSLFAGARPAGSITAMNVKSAFSRPVDGALLASRRFVVRGAAWAGEKRIREVEVSANGGKTWDKALLQAQVSAYSWALWTFDWKIPGAGEYELVARATDEAGQSQPAERASDRADEYEWNAYQRIRVRVV